MKTKQLSRNKTIEALHYATGLSYKACREKLKACDWSLETALEFERYLKALAYIDEIIDIERLTNVIESVSNVIRALAIATGKALDTFNNSFEEELINA